MPSQVNPTAREIIAQYAPNGDTRALPDYQARALAFELSEIAHRDNAADKPWLAIGALAQALRALTSAQPNPHEREGDHERRWIALVDGLQKKEASERGEAKNAAQYGYYLNAAIFEQRADAYLTVLRIMGERTLAEKDEMAGLSALLGRFQDDSAADAKDKGVSPPGD